MDCDKARQVVDKIVIVNAIQNQNGLKYNPKINVEEVSCPLALLYGVGAIERHLEMAQPNKKKPYNRSSTFLFEHLS